MKKPLEIGDSVTVETTVKVRGNETTAYLYGTLVEVSEDGDQWLVAYQLGSEFNAPTYKDWWCKDKITSKHIGNSDNYLFEKAEKVKADDYAEGMVYYGDLFFDNILDLMDWYCNDDVNCPAFVWAASRKPVLISPDLLSYMSELLDDAGYEGMSEDISFKPLFKELEDLQDRFVKLASEQFVYYEVDYKKAILLEEYRND